MGCSETVVAVAEGQTVADVWNQLSGETTLPGNVLMAVNLDYVKPDAPVRDGDEVAFFPPVTGG